LGYILGDFLGDFLGNFLGDFLGNFLGNFLGDFLGDFLVTFSHNHPVALAAASHAFLRSGGKKLQINFFSFFPQKSLS
jgi:membrane protein DedA with SNARE-associated domain